MHKGAWTAHLPTIPEEGEEDALDIHGAEVAYNADSVEPQVIINADQRNVGLFIKIVAL